MTEARHRRGPGTVATDLSTSPRRHPLDNDRAGTDRRRFLGRSLSLLAAGAGAGALAPLLSVGASGPDPDIAALQTAASLENLMVATYTSPGVQRLVAGAGSPFLVAFFARTVEQHLDHARVLNRAVAGLGGSSQGRIDTAVYEKLVVPALAGSPGLAGVLALAARLEEIAAQTQVLHAAGVTHESARGALATIAPVEAQHAVVIETVRAALAAGLRAAAIGLPLALDGLPATAGSWGLTVVTEPTDAARPAGEGAPGGG